MTDQKPPSSIKRFIAGTSCPKCNEVDSTLSYFEGDDMVRECISCGFIEKMSEAQDDEPQSIDIKQL